jgi:hypothetical protein
MFLRVRTYMKIYVDVLGEHRGNAADFFLKYQISLYMFTNETKYLKSELRWLTGPELDLKSETLIVRLMFFYRWITILGCIKSKGIQLNI